MTPQDNLTEEESDALLRQEIFATEDSNSESGTNDSETQVEAPEVQETEEQSEDTSTEETTEEESQEEAGVQTNAETEEKPKKKSNVAKILAEKNEYKRQALEATAKLKELEANLWQTYEKDAEYYKTLVKKEMAEEFEKQHFFIANPKAFEVKWDLDALIEENPSLSYDRAWKFYLAETNPAALLDEQSQNKLNSKLYSSSGRVPSNARATKVEYDYSDSEFEKLVNEWKVRL